MSKPNNDACDSPTCQEEWRHCPHRPPPDDPAMNATSESPLAPAGVRPERPSISVVMPAFNEAQSLPGVLAELSGMLRAMTERWEVLVVDDGSRDDTAAVMTAWVRTAGMRYRAPVAQLRQGSGADGRHRPFARRRGPADGCGRAAPRRDAAPDAAGLARGRRHGLRGARVARRRVARQAARGPALLPRRATPARRCTFPRMSGTSA